ncbi:helix-turn-helix domain-containing protein [Rhizobium sp. SL86]|jgi:transcriptional regulator with XRE-family HTH domain|uniref:helix-turn-helix domain-containing protein n=1 Tax=Rhizobium sp. SL86 TaxID=2995148 RepID=UPI0022747176|nr:helix-turn-helix transcriptional regulator [Rhizobium sp. SL86]MCY1667902.1 helix-turn-helix transcriptional regulator [Rhizobium sp. SL86]
MTISQTQFDTTKSVSIASTIAEARRAAGYSLEDLAIACGLTVGELGAIESGADLDPSRLQRVAAALKLRSLAV